MRNTLIAMMLLFTFVAAQQAFPIKSIFVPDTAVGQAIPITIQYDESFVGKLVQPVVWLNCKNSEETYRYADVAVQTLEQRKIEAGVKEYKYLYTGYVPSTAKVCIFNVRVVDGDAPEINLAAQKFSNEFKVVPGK